MLVENLQPDEVWEYYLSHREDFEDDEFVIAKDEFNGAQISASAIYGYDCLFLSLSQDGEETDCIYVDGEDICDNAIRELRDCLKEITQGAYGVADGCRDPTWQEETIKAREEEIDLAITNMLLEIEPEVFSDLPNTGEIVAELKEAIGDFLYSKYGVSIYRPAYLIDEDGNSVYCAYPYPDIAAYKRAV